MDRTARRLASKAARKAAKKAARVIPLVAAAVVPATAVTTALLSPPSFGASGDLDPSFGDVGRLGPILDGPIWSLEPQLDGSVLFGGGAPGFLYWGEWYGTPGFLRTVSDTGTVDPLLAAGDFGSTQVVGIAQQPDGMVLAAGRQMVYSDTDTRLVVFRILPDGTRDPAFGSDGQFRLSTAEHGFRHGATSLVLDPDGRIVVAGSRDDKLIVLRLLPDGSLDSSFATAGIFAGPANVDYSGGQSGARTNLVRTGGGYRATAAATAGCQVVALKADGTIDMTFGVAGIATVVTGAGPTSWCTSMDVQPDGRLLLAGSANGQGFAERLLPDGKPDPAFAADAVAPVFALATAVAADGNTAAVVAGVDDDGFSVMRLGADGSLDLSFGDAGVTSFDLRTDAQTYPVVNDLFVMADRRIVGAGGVCDPFGCWWYQGAFVFRLLGDGGNSPGVLGISERDEVVAHEGDGEVVLNVRRTGGRSGSVSVDWKTTTEDWYSAGPGTDYTASSGRLTWADGDATSQQIRIPILADDVVEEHETFAVVLSGHEDGAGLGKVRASIVIEPDGAPHGQLQFPYNTRTAGEGQMARFAVSRDFYSSGIVSVTATPVSGTAIAGEDFVADPITVTWADGETGLKEFSIPIIDDSAREDTETFTLTLSAPTGGALIAARSVLTVNIGDNDRPKLSTERGGGALGWLSLLLLGALRLMRRRR